MGGHKAISPCDPAVAQRHTGCMVGGTSPFPGTQARPCPIHGRSILDLPLIYINGGEAFFGVHPDILRISKPTITVAIE